MVKLAVDICLLPPEEVMDICIDINNKAESSHSKLSKIDNLPHITLAMVVVDEQDIPKMAEILEKIAEEHSPVELEIPKIYASKTQFNYTSYGFEIKPSDELTELHAVMVKKIMPFSAGEAKPEMFYPEDVDKINDLTRAWVNNYKKNHVDPASFFPHISLKCKEPKYAHFPIRFKASTLALWQFGVHCTCRKILFSTELKNQEMC